MASKSLDTWRTAGSLALDEIESAHRALGGTGPGRRYTTQQINRAYTVLLSSHFQQFCRDLHSEAAAALSSLIPDARLRGMMINRFTAERKLDKGNPNPGNIGADFWRMHFDLWGALAARSGRNAKFQHSLDDLNVWRNAISHQDFTAPRLAGRTALRLSQVRTWRMACGALAQEMDDAVADYVATITASRPW